MTVITHIIAFICYPKSVQVTVDGVFELNIISSREENVVKISGGGSGGDAQAICKGSYARSVGGCRAGWIRQRLQDMYVHLTEQGQFWIIVRAPASLRPHSGLHLQLLHP